MGVSENGVHVPSRCLKILMGEEDETPLGLVSYVLLESHVFQHHQSLPPNQYLPASTVDGMENMEKWEKTRKITFWMGNMMMNQ